MRSRLRRGAGGAVAMPVAHTVAIVAILLILGAAPAAGDAPPAAAPVPPAAAAAPRDVTPKPAPIPSEAIREAARTIQNTCFALYPPDLLKAMTGSDAPPPEAARSDPQKQIKYLRHETMLDQGLFYPSALEDILPGLMTEVHAGRSFLDLGSGDGRVVFLAAVLGAQATGIEYDPKLHAIAEASFKRLRGGVVPRERVTLLKGDFYTLDWSRYDVLFYFGSGTRNETAMLDKMRREMRPDAVLVMAHRSEPPEGFLSIAKYGVVGTWRRDPDDLPEDDAPRPPRPSTPR